MSDAGSPVDVQGEQEVTNAPSSESDGIVEAPADKVAIDGSGDHLPTKPVSECIQESPLVEESNKNVPELGIKRDDQKDDGNTNKTLIKPIDLKPETIVEASAKDQGDNEELDTDMVPKITEDMIPTSSNLEEAESESQDDEIELKWDDDDEAEFALADDKSVSKNDDDNGEALTEIDNAVNTSEDKDTETEIQKDDKLDKELETENTVHDLQNSKVSETNDKSLIKDDNSEPIEILDSFEVTSTMENFETKESDLESSNENIQDIIAKLDDMCNEETSSDMKTESEKSENLAENTNIENVCEIKSNVDDAQMDVDIVEETTECASSTAIIDEIDRNISNIDNLETVPDSTEEMTDKLETSKTSSDVLDRSTSYGITDHGLNQPNYMTEIPTQELINLPDDSSDADSSTADTSKQEENDVKNITEARDSSVTESDIKDTTVTTEVTSTGIELEKDSETLKVHKDIAIARDSSATESDTKDPTVIPEETSTGIELEKDSEMLKVHKDIAIARDSSATESDTKDPTVIPEETSTAIELEKDSEMLNVSDDVEMEQDVIEAKASCEDIEKQTISTRIEKNTEIDSNQRADSLTNDKDDNTLLVSQPQDQITVESENKADLDIETFLQETQPLDTEMVESQNDIIDISIENALLEDVSSADVNKNEAIVQSVLELTEDTESAEKLISTVEAVKDTSLQIENVPETGIETEKTPFTDSEINKPESDTEIVKESNIDNEKLTDSKMDTEFLAESSVVSVIEDNIKSIAQSELEATIQKDEHIVVTPAVVASNVEADSTADGVSSSKEVSEEIQVPTTWEVPIVSEAAVEIPAESVPSSNDDEQPSTSKVSMHMAAVSSADVAEVTDSLGLLAECGTRPDDDTSGHDDDDDDFDPDDESSNQMAAEQSEDSAQHSESDQRKEQDDDKEGGGEGGGPRATPPLAASDAEFFAGAGGEKEVLDDVICEEIEVGALETVSESETADAAAAEDDDKPGSLLRTLLADAGAEGGAGDADIQEVKSEDVEVVAGEEPPAGKEGAPLSADTPEHKTPAADAAVVSLDSDDDEAKPAPGRCVNPSCSSGQKASLPADPATLRHYEARRDARARVCPACLTPVLQRAHSLISGVVSLQPLLALPAGRAPRELVEISDSGSDGEGDAGDTIGEGGARVVEEKLAAALNETWVKYGLEARLAAAQAALQADLDALTQESEAVSALLNEWQTATDRLRGDLYAAFEPRRSELPALTIIDTPDNAYCAEAVQARYENKRRLASPAEPAAKRAAPPGPPAPADDTGKDDDKDVSVVQLCRETPPPWLPPPGTPRRPALTPGAPCYAMRNAFGSWIKARVVEITPKGTSPVAATFSQVKVRFEHKPRAAYKTLPARCLAYLEPSEVRMTIGTRVIALFKDTSSAERQRIAYYSGVVAEIPNPVNKYRYLVFFDDGYAQYVQHSDTRLVCEYSSLVWEEVHPFSREFVKEYLLAYPERPMVRLHAGQNIKVEWNGKWWTCRVVQVDASLVQLYFEQDRRTEWVYRGSTRLAPLYLELQHGRPAQRRLRPKNKANVPYVEYTRSEEDNKQQASKQEEIRRQQRAVAKKSTVSAPAPPAPAPPSAPANLDTVTSRVVYYTPKNAVKPLKMVPHTCGPRCRRADVLALKDLRTYNPLAKPLLSGWERLVVRWRGGRAVSYRAPCGRRLRGLRELQRYLRAVRSDMAVDLFDFSPNTHCLAEFVLNKCIVGKKDLSHGKENVPVPCVNYYDDSLPEFCSYNTERTPTAGVPLNLDPDFLCGCDCTGDCEDKSKCACWQLTLEGARTIGLEGRVGYEYRRLPEPLPSGIYECNVRCKCRQTCLNRVAQHPLQLKLQVFKTLNRGWGIRALNDVPKGAFLCIYAGNLLTDATANLDGLNEGDEYLAELDYIEVVEQMKEGYEREVQNPEPSDEEAGSDTESASSGGGARADGDFTPAVDTGRVAQFSKRLRKREKKKQKEDEEDKEKEKEKEKDKEKEKEKTGNEEDCITISDDEELREPARFAAAAGLGGECVPKHRSVRALFGADEACYIMDAKVQGNIGRYLNHSCSPNVFVQNVFVDTHDPRFPWVAFFALTHIRAGTELTWNYNYDVGSVPGKALYCYCGAANCRGRLL